MFNIGPGELLAICGVALIVLGPQRLPDALRSVGRAIGELRRISSGFQDELRRAIDESPTAEEDADDEAVRKALGAEPEPMQMPTDLPADLPTIEPFGAKGPTPRRPAPAQVPDPEPAQFDEATAASGHTDGVESGAADDNGHDDDQRAVS